MTGWPREALDLAELAVRRVNHDLARLALRMVVHLAVVADRLGRDAILIELNPDYREMAKRRLRKDAPLFSNFTLRGAS